MDLIKRDLASVWHPCSQMKDYESFPPLRIAKARGSYLILENGTRVLDAISSWWCKGLGHAHPRLQKALIKQAKKFEHVILANTTNEIIVELSERLCQLSGGGRKAFYASDGSCAVEIALKMTVQARQLRGQNKNLIGSLSNGYHGETLFALTVSDQGLYRKPFEHLMKNSVFIQDVPYVNSSSDASWSNCESNWIKVESQLTKIKDNLSAIILEPILQGAGGMLVYSADFLARLSVWCQANDVYLIADEIMTGLGRTGKLFAYEHASIQPDIVCLGKGLTSGYIPMSAVLVKDAIYTLFYNDYETSTAFLHSHTYCGHALAAAVALETLNVINEENVVTNCKQLEKLLSSCMLDVAEKTKKLAKVRYIGGVVAADIITNRSQDRVGYKIYREAVKLGALLRPLGNTLYWLPPLNSKERDVKKLRDITIKAIMSILR